MDSLSNAFVAGATDYVTKPVNRVELVARVRAAIRLKSELDRRLQREQELLTFLSDWGSRRANLWIDEPTGLFVGEIAEAYLMAANKHRQSDEVSILAVMLDGFESHRAAHGNAASHTVLGQVAHAMRMLIASVGIIAAAYPNGIIILVAPEFAANSARQFAESVRATVSKLRLPHPEADAFDHVTASVVAVTGNVQREVDRVHLLTQAISRVQDVSSSGGNRVLALTV
jgi:PleD family two-component response regulator